MSLDARDVRILRSIAENDSTSPERIQEETGIPKSTVHYRIKNMKERGVIKNDLFEIDFEKAGLGLTVITEVLAEFGEGYQEKVGRELADIEGVNEVYFMMGDTDFIVVSRLPSRDMVETLVEGFEAVDGIQRTSSKFVITSIKADESVGMLRDYGEETLLRSHGLEEADGDIE
ncbi:transcriptional regulator [Halorubrum sp. Ib24]|uniref:Lrp/AsnC family transcriptional regulator n=1 Tax=Halorubrum sp. Ib24 TaxID=1383850 RepID=UPI000B988080|nr:Lrp/AsnC family transcriptional regulator [Halorubrum sp. Ib24]OYR39820.1 transcriptional regulator [Halorubrum sp. Ib24]